MSADQISKGSPDGTLIGQSATDKLGFYSITTAIVQPVTFSAVSTTAVVSTSSNASTFGFQSSGQAAALFTAVNNIITALKNLGLVASS